MFNFDDLQMIWARLPLSIKLIVVFAAVAALWSWLR